MECRSVLVVDDDQAIRDSLQEALVMEGYVVHTAINGQDALDFLNSLSKRLPARLYHPRSFNANNEWL